MNGFIPSPISIAQKILGNAAVRQPFPYSPKLPPQNKHPKPKAKNITNKTMAFSDRPHGGLGSHSPLSPRQDTDMYGAYEASSHQYSQQSGGLKRSEKLLSVLQRMREFSENDNDAGVEWRNDKDNGLEFEEGRDDFPSTEARETQGNPFMHNHDDERISLPGFQQSHSSGAKQLLHESRATPIRMENVHSIWSAQDETNEAPREDIIRLRIQEAVKSHIYSSTPYSNKGSNDRKTSQSGSSEMRRDTVYSGRNIDEARYRSNTVLNVREIDSDTSEEEDAHQGKLAYSPRHRDGNADAFHQDTIRRHTKPEHPERRDTGDASKEIKSTRPSLLEEDASNDSGGSESESSSGEESAASDSSDDVSSITAMNSQRLDGKFENKDRNKTESAGSTRRATSPLAERATDLVSNLVKQLSLDQPYVSGVGDAPQVKRKTETKDVKVVSGDVQLRGAIGSKLPQSYLSRASRRSTLRADTSPRAWGICKSTGLPDLSGNCAGFSTTQDPIENTDLKYEASSKNVQGTTDGEKFLPGPCGKDEFLTLTEALVALNQASHEIWDGVSTVDMTHASTTITLPQAADLPGDILGVLRPSHTTDTVGGSKSTLPSVNPALPSMPSSAANPDNEKNKEVVPLSSGDMNINGKRNPSSLRQPTGEDVKNTPNCETADDTVCTGSLRIDGKDIGRSSDSLGLTNGEEVNNTPACESSDETVCTGSHCTGHRIEDQEKGKEVKNKSTVESANEKVFTGSHQTESEDVKKSSVSLEETKKEETVKITPTYEGGDEMISTLSREIDGNESKFRQKKGSEDVSKNGIEAENVDLIAARIRSSVPLEQVKGEGVNNTYAHEIAAVEMNSTASYQVDRKEAIPPMLKDSEDISEYGIETGYVEFQGENFFGGTSINDLANTQILHGEDDPVYTEASADTKVKMIISNGINVDTEGIEITQEIHNQAQENSKSLAAKKVKWVASASKKFDEERHQKELVARIKEFQERREQRQNLQSYVQVVETIRTAQSPSPSRGTRPRYSQDIKAYGSLNRTPHKNWPTLPSESVPVTGKKVAQSYLQAISRKQAIRSTTPVDSFEQHALVPPEKQEASTSPKRSISTPGAALNSPMKQEASSSPPKKSVPVAGVTSNKALPTSFADPGRAGTTQSSKREHLKRSDPSSEWLPSDSATRGAMHENGAHSSKSKTKTTLEAQLSEALSDPAYSMWNETHEPGKTVDQLVSRIDRVVHNLLRSGKIEKMASTQRTESGGLEQRNLQKNTAELLRNLAVLRARRSLKGGSDPAVQTQSKHSPQQGDEPPQPIMQPQMNSITAKNPEARRSNTAMQPPAKQPPRHSSQFPELPMSSNTARNHGAHQNKQYSAAKGVDNNRLDAIMGAKPSVPSKNGGGGNSIMLLRAKRDNAARKIIEESHKLSALAKGHVEGVSATKPTVLTVKSRDQTTTVQPIASHGNKLYEERFVANEKSGVLEIRKERKRPPKPEHFGARTRTLRTQKDDSSHLNISYRPSPRITSEGSTGPSPEIINLLSPVYDQEQEPSYKLSSQMGDWENEQLQNLPMILAASTTNGSRTSSPDFSDQGSSVDQSSSVTDSSEFESDFGSSYDDRDRLERIESMIHELRERKTRTRY